MMLTFLTARCAGGLTVETTAWEKLREAEMQKQTGKD